MDNRLWMPHSKVFFHCFFTFCSLFLPHFLHENSLHSFVYMSGKYEEDDYDSVFAALKKSELNILLMERVLIPLKCNVILNWPHKILSKNVFLMLLFTAACSILDRQ